MSGERGAHEEHPDEVASVLRMVAIAFVQARMGSTRLPGKVLEPLARRPSLLRITDRLERVRGLDSIAVLTSAATADDAIAGLCDNAGLTCLRGAEHDVLDRFHLGIQRLAPELILRITADCPLVDPGIVSDLIELYRARPGVIYASVATGALSASAGYSRFPDGLDAEAVSPAALEQAWREARDPYEREHVTPFVWRHPERFAAAVLECDEDHGDERWTVDYPADLDFVRAVYERLGECPFDWRAVVALLEREPALRALNQRQRASGD